LQAGRPLVLCRQAVSPQTGIASALPHTHHTHHTHARTLPTHQIFATPRRHYKSKPFFDHVMSFTYADGRVWFRNYQVRAGCTGWWVAWWVGRLGGAPVVVRCALIGEHTDGTHCADGARCPGGARFQPSVHL